MKEIKLTQGKVALVDDGDYEFINHYKWSYNAGYAIRGVYNKLTKKIGRVSMHRLIIGAKKGQEVDHKDGDKLNNQRSNLRIATRAQNVMNTGLISSNTSGFKGTYFKKKTNRWFSCIRIGGKLIHLGYFDNKIKAANAYNKAARKYFGEFAKLNNI